MLEEIEKVEKKISLLREYYDYLEVKHKEAYKIDCLYCDSLIPSNSKVGYKIKDLEYIKDVLKKLVENDVDITKKYFITDNIYLQVYLWGDNFTFHFYVENDGWIYDNYISSHSGINEWITKLIEDEYDLFSGNSSYTYAFGCCTLRDYKFRIENKKENDYSDRRYSYDKVVEAIKELIKFFTDEDNKTRNVIVEEVNRKLDNMKKLIDE